MNSFRFCAASLFYFLVFFKELFVFLFLVAENRSIYRPISRPKPVRAQSNFNPYLVFLGFCHISDLRF
jgi:hypothetical protein